MHTRLSPSTVRLTDSSKIIQICSLGHVSPVGSELSPAVHGIPWGAAPEMLSSSPSECNASVDVFAVGCVAYYILTGGAHPFGKFKGAAGGILLVRF